MVLVPVWECKISENGRVFGLPGGFGGEVTEMITREVMDFGYASDDRNEGHTAGGEGEEECEGKKGAHWALRVLGSMGLRSGERSWREAERVLLLARTQHITCGHCNLGQ